MDHELPRLDIPRVHLGGDPRVHLARVEEQPVEEQKVRAHDEDKVQVVRDLALVRARVVLRDHGEEEHEQAEAGLNQRVPARRAGRAAARSGGERW